MLQIPKGQTTEAERAILRHLRVWIAALAVGCPVVGAPEALSASFAEIARRVEPAVVNIDTVSAAPQVADKDGDDDEAGEEGGDNPLLDMLRRHARRPSRGVGSGFIVDPKGIIVTNYHVVENMSGIMVKLQT